MSWNKIYNNVTINTYQLYTEIKLSSLGWKLLSNGVAPDGSINTSNTTLNIILNNDPTSAQETTLDGLITAHVAVTVTIPKTFGIIADRPDIDLVTDSFEFYASDTYQTWIANGGVWFPKSGVIRHPIIQDRTTADYTYLASGDGVEITQLTKTITPIKSGLTVSLEYNVFTSSNRDSVGNNYGYVVSRNGVLLPDASDGSNNRYAVITTPTFDGNAVNTAQVTRVRIFDKDTLDTASTYRLLVRATGGQTGFLYYNKTEATPADNAETGLSTLEIKEYMV